MLTVPQESWEWHCLKQSPGMLKRSGIACIFRVFFKQECMDLELPACYSAYFQPFLKSSLKIRMHGLFSLNKMDLSLPKLLNELNLLDNQTDHIVQYVAPQNVFATT